ncbi:MAG: type I pullulanase [Paludibacteraceae bacterium]|nr:type I pullulanase [Paludibacteraceae bacterium]
MRNTLLMILACLLIGCATQPNKLENECVYTPEKTIFTFWSSVAEKMEVRLYNTYDATEFEVITLQEKNDDFWTATVKGDQLGKFYTVCSYQNGEWGQESPGIFAKAVSVNGQRAAIIDMQATDPQGWENDQRPAMTDPTDVVVYETHMRDFTIDATSGIANKGKFIAFTEQGTQTAEGLASGIDHLKELGITHIQILPMYDYGSIDETTLDLNKYNWGYDPVNYNVPEGGYSTNPYDPATRIREAKTMIQALHAAGIRVIMDVVYNHTYSVEGCALGRVVPQYFYRMNEDGTYANGSGCGNETASDKEMMRQFMVESVCYWAREYHIDGFRFDLMGIHDQETMRQIRAALDEIDPSIITYGEGWAASSPAYPYEQLAMKQWTYTMPRVGAFSDDIRNALIGSPFDHHRGFASGNTASRDAVRYGLVACPDWSGEPMQHVSYITCHDNYCLRDRIEVAAAEETEATKLRMNKLAQTTVMVSQGMTFFYGGEELFRTKQGVENSYQSPDSINVIEWANKQTYNDLYTYYREIIKIRRQHKGFRLGTAELVKNHVEFPETTQEGLIIYRIKDLQGIDTAASLVVLLNGTPEPMEVEVPQATYTVLAHDAQANASGMGTIEGGKVQVAPYSATILAEMN